MRVFANICPMIPFVATVQCDNKPLYMFTTTHKLTKSMPPIDLHTQKDGQLLNVDSPPSLPDY